MGKKTLLIFVLLSSLVTCHETQAWIKNVILGGSAVVNGGVSLVTGVVAGVALKAAADCFDEGTKMAKHGSSEANAAVALFGGGIMGTVCGVTGLLIGGVSVVTGISSVMSLLGILATR